MSEESEKAREHRCYFCNELSERSVCETCRRIFCRSRHAANLSEGEGADE